MDKERPIEVQQGTHADDRVVQTLSAAFQNDPALAWLLPDPVKRKRKLVPFFKAMVGQSMRNGQVLASRQGEAASLWYPPGDVKDGFVAGLRDNLSMVGVFGASLPKGLAMAKAMYDHHPVPQADLYLRYVGVRPDKQGKGWGGKVIRAGIEIARQQGAGVLLETAEPDNVAIYSRLGFEIISEWEVPDFGPKFWTMRRPFR